MPERRAAGARRASGPTPPEAHLDALEQDRRAAVLRDIEERVRRDGPHVARAHPDRARQFMPFAALKGYHELAHEQEGRFEDDGFVSG